MISLPLPILTAIFLAIVLLRRLNSKDRWGSPLVFVTIGLYALQSLLIGIKWTLGGFPSLFLVSVSLAIPPMTWLVLSSLIGRSKEANKQRDMMVALGSAASFVIAVNIAALLDYFVFAEAISIGVYMVYGAAFIVVAYLSDHESMESQPLHMLFPARLASLVAGCMFLLSAIIDLIIACDIQWNNSSISSALVGYGNLFMLLVLISLFLGVGSRPIIPSAEADAEEDSRRDDRLNQEIVDRLDRLMTDTKLFRDESLSLDRLARKLGQPSRQISTAVNSLRAMNVPQYVNTFRIADACDLLETTNESITEIIYKTGFTTKSNFHREFQRITGYSPGAWRKRSLVPDQKGTRVKMDHLRIADQPIPMKG
ncbi:helix-turn-helix domain-containing protein [Rhizobium sp. SYY.PMSO]|uniref:helix-turn-helix domain-containing protein n=1 Tax=Rhizobium sp. SYY.PMSO TaxID=3382192 RepID=UPI00399027C5